MIPPSHLALRPFQGVGASFLAARSRAAIFDWMGLGKTPQAISALNYLPAPTPVIVVAPLATLRGWERELSKWSKASPPRGLRRIQRRHTSLQVRDIIANGQFVGFIAWTDLKQVLEAVTAACHLLRNESSPPPCIIFDEAHRAKGGQSVAMSKAATGGWKKDADGGWQRIPGLVDCAKITGWVGFIWLLTGTPMPNGRPIELFPLLNMLGVVGGQGARMSKKAYEERFCKQYNAFSPSGFDMNGCRNLDELNALLVSCGCILRRTPGDVQGELPELQRSIVPLEGVECRDIDAHVDAAAILDAMRDAGEANPDEKPKLTKRGLPVFEEMAEYRAKLGARKVPAAIAWCESWFEDAPEGAAIVLFVHHKEVGRMLAEHFKCEFASGDDAPEERQAKVDRFAAPTGPKVLVATMAACGTGMNGMQLRTSYCAFVECAWEPATLDQAEGRIRRMGAATAALAVAYYLAVADALDQHIVELVKEKRSAVEKETVSKDLAPAAPPAPQPTPALGVDMLPDPGEFEWSWSKDQRTGEWLARAPFNVDAQAAKAWVGAQVRVVARSTGKVAERVLVRLVAGGPHNGGWSVWAHGEVTNASHRARGRFLERMRRRLDREDALLVTLSEESGRAPLTPTGLACAEACAEAASVLTACDADRARERNMAGWSQADVTVGRILAAIEPGDYTAATLEAARRILRTYRRTQIVSLAARIWPEPAAA